MIFWEFNVGDKLVLNPEEPENPEESKEDMEREYYVVDRYIEGVEEGIALDYPNVRMMYVLLGASSHTLQAVDKYDVMNKLSENNGEVKRHELGIPKWTKVSVAWPRKGDTYYTPNILSPEKYLSYKWVDSNFDKNNIRNHLVFVNKEEAIKMTERMLGVAKQ